MSAIVIKPKQSIHLLLNNAYNMNNPRLSIRLDDGTINNDDDNDGSTFENQFQCQNCDSLKHMLTIRDKTIMKLVEDRDQLKIKLTKVMNQNIELSRQLIKYQHLSEKNKQVATDQTSDKMFQELNFYKKKCQELDDINKHLKQNLYSLRDAFALLGNDEYQDLPSCSSSNSGSSTSSGNTVVERNPNLSLTKTKSSPNPDATFIVANNPPDNVVDSSANQCPDASLKQNTHQPKIINNQFQPTPESSNSKAQETPIVSNQNNEERSTFDLWYNS